MLLNLASGFANTQQGKAVILERTKALIEKSNLMLVVPFEGVSKEQVDMLRKTLPKTTTASVVKNSLLRVAATGTKFESVGNGLKEENIFFFIEEGSSKETYDALKKWQKEVKRTEPNFDVKVAILENTPYTGKSIEAVVNLPTKKQLITKIAQGIKAVPTKVAKGIKAVPNKLGRAIGAIKNKLEEESKA